jgi:hypothetical protein
MTLHNLKLTIPQGDVVSRHSSSVRIRNDESHLSIPPDPDLDPALDPTLKLGKLKNKRILRVQKRDENIGMMPYSAKNLTLLLIILLIIYILTNMSKKARIHPNRKKKCRIRPKNVIPFSGLRLK